MRRLAENNMNISSEMILKKLFEKSTLQPSWEVFRSKIKDLEKEFLRTLDLSILMKEMKEWNDNYKFTSD